MIFLDEKPRFTFVNFLHLFIQGPPLTHSALHWYSFDKVWYLQWYGMVWFGICNGMVWYDIECAHGMVWYDYGVECAHVSPFMPLPSTYPAF